jgi:hypothetical protein
LRLDRPADHAQVWSKGRDRWRQIDELVKGLADSTLLVVEAEGGRQIPGITRAV